jgi:CBS domain-containing protein
VQDVMTAKVITFHPDDPVRDIARTMQEQRINRVPIVDEAGVLVGILTRGDIIHALAQRL